MLKYSGNQFVDFPLTREETDNQWWFAIPDNLKEAINEFIFNDKRYRELVSLPPEESTLKVRISIC